MKFLANENFPLKSILYLESKGFDIKSIGKDLPGIQDQLIIVLADQEERTILMFDRDYGELIFKHNLKPRAGVIYLRLDHYSPQDPGIIIEQICADLNIKDTNTFTVIDKNGIRQRRY